LLFFVPKSHPNLPPLDTDAAQTRYIFRASMARKTDLDIGFF
jgi:hypothetical protein